MTRLYASNTSQSGIDTRARAANSRGDERIHELPRERWTIASAKRMNPVQQMGVFHDANGSMPANVAACEMRMMASPISINTSRPRNFTTTEGTDTNRGHGL